MPRAYDTYQYLGDGKEYHWKNEREKESRFWNDGRWQSFIKPYLPEDASDMTLVDVGCNSGLFCKLAKDHGFRHAIGIDTHEGAIARGIEWRDSIGYDYELIHHDVRNMDTLPLADVYVMSCVHYYFRMLQWLNMVDRLRTKTRRLVMVSKPLRKDYSRRVLLEDIDRFFDGWHIDEQIHIDRKDDPAPRGLYGLSFEAPALKRVKIHDTPGHPLADLLYQFYRGDEEPYLKHWTRKKNERTARMMIRSKRRLKEQIRKEGQRAPVILEKGNNIIDGAHRIAAMDSMGYKTVLARYI